MSQSTIRAAQVTAWGSAPKLTKIASPSPPPPNHTQIHVQAVGLHNVVRSRASGGHYSSGPLPHTPGVDGTGLALPSMTPVYFSAFATGSMAEFINVPNHSVFPLPADKLKSSGVSLAAVASWVNPAMSSWMAMKKRVILSEAQKKDGFSVLVIGATSASGQLAIKLACKLGATRIVGAARSEAGMAKLGLDKAVVLKENVKETDFSEENIGSVDVVLDYVYGDLVEWFFESVKPPANGLQYVHIGALGGRMEMNLQAALLRGKDITIRGAGPGAWAMKDLGSEMGELTKVLVDGELLVGLPVKEVSIDKVEETWAEKASDRVAFTF